MTELLEKAFEEASKLPPDEQETFAAWLLEELASGESWKKSLGSSAGALERLAEEALKEHRQGKTKTLDPDEI